MSTNIAYKIQPLKIVGVRKHSVYLVFLSISFLDSLRFIKCLIYGAVFL
jgi:hypothetical protein